MNIKPSFSFSFDPDRDYSISMLSLFLNSFGEGPISKITFGSVLFPEEEVKNSYNFIEVLNKITNSNFEYSFIENDFLDKNQYLSNAIFIEKSKKIMVNFFFSPKERVFSRISVYHNTNFSQETVGLINSYLSKYIDKKIKNKPQINILCHSSYRGFYTSAFNIKDNEVSLDDNYNNDFLQIDELIKDFLRKEDESGLVICSGIPGTGKTYYFRHLIKWANELKLERGDLVDDEVFGFTLSTTTQASPVIYIPSGMSERLADPSFIPFLSNQTGSIILIEDAEKIVQSRENSDSAGAVSDLLNLTDGILGDALKLKIILSFNLDINKIDQALLRKGRLKAKYEFKELSVEKSNNLLKKLNIDFVTESPMTITDIYNLKDKSFNERKSKRCIGFK